jgi:FADH2 O2-dependent halogenase
VIDGAYDIAVIGSGFAGSLFAMIAARLGRRVVLLERGRHPRFVIGESSTPLANLLWEQLARRYDLPRLAPLAKWGTWQASYPHIGCGLKRGFTFYRHVAGERFQPMPDRSNELLVAASPRDEIADTHWYRPNFDQFLVSEAKGAGVDYVDETGLDGVQLSDGCAELFGSRHGEAVIFRAGLVVDASGSRGFLHKTLALPERRFAHLPPTCALFSHFQNVVTPQIRGDPPYPPHQAAVHHVFDGGWVWVLRFNNGITSAGVAMHDSLVMELRPGEGEAAWDRLLQRFPSLGDELGQAAAVRPFTFMPRLGFASRHVFGPRWILLPSAAGFVDPLLSTGFPLTLLGIARLARLLEAGTEADAGSLRDYGRRTQAELDATALLVAALYASMADFPTFVNLTMLYFAAVSYAEAAHRHGRPELGESFLLPDHPTFGKAARECCRRAIEVPSSRLDEAERARFAEQVRHAIAPINLAGLADPLRHNWYPAAEALPFEESAASLRPSDSVRHL